jgi:hypothetical protein
MGKTNKWIHEHREFKGGKHMYKFDFKTFMTRNCVTVEQLQNLLGYSFIGITNMLMRGTIKVALLEELKKKYPDAEKYKQ